MARQTDPASVAVDAEPSQQSCQGRFTPRARSCSHDTFVAEWRETSVASVHLGDTSQRHEALWMWSKRKLLRKTLVFHIQTSNNAVYAFALIQCWRGFMFWCAESGISFHYGITEKSHNRIWRVYRNSFVFSLFRNVVIRKPRFTCFCPFIWFLSNERLQLTDIFKKHPEFWEFLRLLGWILGVILTYYVLFFSSFLSCLILSYLSQLTCPNICIVCRVSHTQESQSIPACTESVFTLFLNCVCISFHPHVSHAKLFVLLLWQNVDRCGWNTVSHIKQSFPYGKQTYNNSSDWLVQTEAPTSWLLWRISVDLFCFCSSFHFYLCMKTPTLHCYLLLENSFFF